MLNLIRICLVVGMIMMLSSCAVKKPIIITEEVELAPAAVKLAISNVSVDKKTFDPSKGETVKIRYKLSKQANVTVKIYDSDDNCVRVMKSVEIDKQGYNEKIWDGKDDAGNILPSEVYIYTIQARDVLKDEVYIYDIADDTGGIELTLRGLNFNNQTGQIDYILPKAARVRIRIGIKDGGPLLRTLLDWQPQEAGKHTVVWDGMDASGVMNLLGNPNIFVNIAAFSLPENSLILQGGKKPEYKQISGKEKRPGKETNIKKNIHALHKRAKCHEPNFDFEIFGIEEYNKDNVPVITEDIIPIRINIDEQDKIDLINSRFEIIFFIDNIFIFEEEEGTSPFTYRFNTKGLSEGEHIITVNIYGFNDHIASRSKRILIKAKR